jgi:hypothetical protein
MPAPRQRVTNECSNLFKDLVLIIKKRTIEQELLPDSTFSMACETGIPEMVKHPKL